MKKVLVFTLLIAFTVLCGVGFALASDAIMESASAASITLVVDSGVVRPDLLPGGFAAITHLNDFLPPSSAIQLDPGYYYNGTGSAGLISGGATGSSYCVLSAGCSLYIVFEVDSPGYYTFTTMYNNTYSGTFLSSSYITNTSYTQWNNIAVNTDVYTGQNFYCFWTSYLSGMNKIVFKVNRPDYSIEFVNAKVEKVPSYPSSRQTAFSGFILPGTTYDDSGTLPDEPDDPEVDPYENWDGVVRANYLKNSGDFWNYANWTLPSASNISNGKITASTGNAPTYLLNNSDGLSLAAETPVTLSIYVDSLIGDAYLTMRDVTVVYPDDEPIPLVAGVNYVTLSCASSFSPNFCIYLDESSTITFSWVKLELGSLFTGYVPNYDDIKISALQEYYNSNGGWVTFDYFRDYLHTDYYIGNISSENGGTVSYTENVGAVFTAPVAATSFELNTMAAIATYNKKYTIAIGYTGNFNIGDVQVSITYDSYTAFSDVYPWNGTDTITTTLFWNLVPGEIFVTTLSPICNFPDVSFTCAQGVDFALQAFSVTTGSTFYRFPVDGVPDTSRWLTGYNSGVAAGTDYGYSLGLREGQETGYDVGFSAGYSQGKTVGYSDGVTDSADGGNWMSMFSALIDVPVSTITGFLDVEILGFNFLTLFRTLVLLSLLFFVIKVLVGKYA